MKLSSCFSVIGVVTVLVACGGSAAPPEEPQSIATPVPNGGTWSSKTSAGTTPPTSNPTTSGATTTSAAQAVPAAPAIAPQAPPVQPVAAGPCDACKGLVSPELQSALNKRAEDARVCYQRVLTNHPAARASMGIDIRIGRDGSSCDAVAQVDQTDWPGLSDCVVTEFRRGGFPSPGSACVIAHVPILFTPKVR